MKAHKESATESEAAQGAPIDLATELPAPTADAEFAEDASGSGGERWAAAREIEESEGRERDQLLDRLARLQAEFDNARKRAEREQIEFRDYATGSVVEKFLPVIDNFGLALRSTGSAHQACAQAWT